MAVASPCAFVAPRDEDHAASPHYVKQPARTTPYSVQSHTHLFEQFHRASNVVGRIAGTGIGLAAVRHIVEQHGGTISVDTREGVGSTFTVRLPISPG